MHPGQFRQSGVDLSRPRADNVYPWALAAVIQTAIRETIRSFNRIPMCRLKDQHD